MALAFDTLGYAKHLEGAGVVRKHADAHAEAAQDLIMPELATKADILELKHLIELQSATMKRQSLDIKVWLGGTILATAGALGALIATF